MSYSWMTKGGYLFIYLFVMTACSPEAMALWTKGGGSDLFFISLSRFCSAYIPSTLRSALGAFP
jgi:hypothetical protein